MSVESFDPNAKPASLGAEVLAELLDAARSLETDDFGLTSERIGALAAVARHEGDADWATAAVGLDPAELVALIRLFTVAERLPGWAAGPGSPVIPLARELKKRGAYPDDLTAWIKARTDNRFLPYGSLLDRL